MRLISQDGKFDIPYDEIVVELFDCCVVGRLKEYIGRDIILGSYSTESKAEKAMEMLREQFSQSQVFKILSSGTIEHMTESLPGDEFFECYLKFREMCVFQFPQDEDVEV